MRPKNYSYKLLFAHLTFKFNENQKLIQPSILKKLYKFIAGISLVGNHSYFKIDYGSQWPFSAGSFDNKIDSR
jgi:hypothetical protein